MFLCFCILRLWLGSSNFYQKVHMLLCFYFSEDVPVDTALDIVHRQKKKLQSLDFPDLFQARRPPIVGAKSGFLSCPCHASPEKNIGVDLVTLAARGLEELFFQLCHCIRFLVVAGNGFWFYFYS
jgi:hypothetical protein